MFLSWNGGKDWSPFQLNLPVTPITDLRVHKGNLIAATSGRSFWILDDLSVIRQYKKDAPRSPSTGPTSAYLVNGSSELDRTEEEFTGANTFRGVNPATGVVLYYQLPELKKTDEITMEIKDAAGNTVRSFSSKADEKFVRYDGGPRPDPRAAQSERAEPVCVGHALCDDAGRAGRSHRRQLRRAQSAAGEIQCHFENGRTDCSQPKPRFSPTRSTRRRLDLYAEYHQTMLRWKLS